MFTLFCDFKDRIPAKIIIHMTNDVGASHFIATAIFLQSQMPWLMVSLRLTSMFLTCLSSKRNSSFSGNCTWYPLRVKSY